MVGGTTEEEEEVGENNMHKELSNDDDDDDDDDDDLAGNMARVRVSIMQGTTYIPIPKIKSSKNHPSYYLSILSLSWSYLTFLSKPNGYLYSIPAAVVVVVVVVVHVQYVAASFTPMVQYLPISTSEQEGGNHGNSQYWPSV